MPRIASAAGSIALLAAGLFAGSAPAQANTACTLELSKYLYNGANVIMWSQGLSGCAGEVEWEVHSYCAAQGQWIVWSQATSYYDNERQSMYGDTEFPDYMRVYAKFGTQEKMTAPAVNNNGGGDCVPPL